MPVSSGRKPFKVVHISDVHIDRQYEVCGPDLEGPAACRYGAGRQRGRLRADHVLSHDDVRARSAQQGDQGARRACACA